MIQVSDEKIGTREFYAILYIMMAIRITDSTPNLLLDKGINAAWMMPIISAAFLLGPLLLLLRLLKKHNAGLLEILFELTGTFFGRLITFAMFLAVFSSTAINSRNYADILISMYYPNTSVFFILVVLVLTVSFYIAHRGLEAIGQASWLIVPVFMVTSLLLVVAMIKKMNYLFIFPIAGSGAMQLVKGGAEYSAFFGDIILVGVLFSHVRTFDAYQKAALWGFGVSTVKMALYLAVYVMMFDYPAVQDIAFPYHHLTRMAMIGSLANHVEVIFLALWFLGAAIHFAIYLYLSALLLGKVMNFKPFNRLLFPLAGLAVLLGVMMENTFQGFQVRGLLLKSSSSLFLLLPVVLWGVDLFRGRIKK
ncbi:GerAB/ArcD/ProY family transporter [Pseudobacillus sp. 179-B 2D1 NHS]|uniref:GerAB/ArcD/ProY family transporter n=1 Tax=Pseudobacillus sp. 179-B 2D1 NHS TaxID=3374292 RepID=UPI003879C015